MSFLVELFVSILIVAGAGFALIGSIGLVRLPDFYTRLHAPTKATTLGMGCLLIASIVLISLAEAELSVHELLITLFLFITAPVTAHMLAKTALHYDIGFVRGTKGKELASKARERVSPAENDE